MNMKKTLASVMAGAMAVSAMAATVSADQDTISLTYDLKTYVETESDGQATYTETYAQATKSTAYLVPMTATTLSFGANQQDVRGGWMRAIAAEIVVSGIDSENNNAGTTTLKYTNDKDFAGKNPTYTYDETKFGTDWASDPAIWYVNVPLSIDGSTKGINLANYNLKTLGYSEEAIGGQDPADWAGFSSVTVRMVYKVAPKVTVSAGNVFPEASNYLGIDVNSKEDLTLKELNNGYEYYYDDNGTLKKATVAGVTPATTPFTSFVDGKQVTVLPSTAGFTSLDAGTVEDAIYPMKSGLNNPANVVKALEARKAGGAHYTSPVAVINDAIANHENVTFTFTAYNGYVATNKSVLAKGTWINADRAYGWQTSSYDWYNPTFGQHLYTDNGMRVAGYSLFDVDSYDMYGSYSSAWAQNLFTGAITVNSGLSMQLNDTDKFVWGANTLTFDWFTITDEGKVSDAKTFLVSMLLYTPVDWYWDNLTVTVGDGESVDPGEGIDGEGDTIDDEVDEIVDEIVDEVEETPVVEEIPVEEVAPVPAAPSPSTGNAPVALAVIPVALAAAAVVAKKRG